MRPSIGIRREDKNRWERRAPLTPADVRGLVGAQGIDVFVQPSPIRTFSDLEYAKAGAHIAEDLGGCSVVFGVKEMPEEFFTQGVTYLFFTHTHKGQAQNMAMLRALMARGCQLIDYERIVDDQGRRLLFFGEYAGLAGMIDALWALGRRLHWEGHDTPLSSVKMAHEYGNLDEAMSEIRAIGEHIALVGLPSALAPLVVGVAGYGHVSQGAQQILDLLPTREITPAELLASSSTHLTDANRVIKVVFKEEHTVAPRSDGASFDLQEFYAKPELYRSRFAEYLPHLTMLVNAIYWDERYPRLVTKADARRLYEQEEAPVLRVIADISCDIEGAIECTVRATDPDSPVYVYDPVADGDREGWEGRGPVVVAVDNLPCELPREASEYFSNVLVPYVRPMAVADYSQEFAQCDLPPAVRRGVILYQGSLTQSYSFMEQFLKR
jgi:alpha-aminoadipic semialdehyde synthase